MNKKYDGKSGYLHVFSFCPLTKTLPLNAFRFSSCLTFAFLCINSEYLLFVHQSPPYFVRHSAGFLLIEINGKRKANEKLFQLCTNGTKHISHSSVKCFAYYMQL